MSIIFQTLPINKMTYKSTPSHMHRGHPSSTPRSYTVTRCVCHIMLASPLNTFWLLLCVLENTANCVSSLISRGPSTRGLKTYTSQSHFKLSDVLIVYRAHSSLLFFTFFYFPLPIPLLQFPLSSQTALFLFFFTFPLQVQSLSIHKCELRLQLFPSLDGQTVGCTDFQSSGFSTEAESLRITVIFDPVHGNLSSSWNCQATCFVLFW